MSDFLVAVASSAVVLGTVAFLAKSIVNRQLDRNMTNYTMQLQASTTKQIELYRSDLEVERMRIQISYGGIFEKQAFAVMELHQLAVDFSRQAMVVIYAADDDMEAIEELKRVWADLHAAYERQRILLPRELDEKFNLFAREFFWKVFRYRRIQSRYQFVSIDAQFDRLADRQEQFRKVIEEDMPALLEEMVAIMRCILGTGGPTVQGGSPDA